MKRPSGLDNEQVRAVFFVAKHIEEVPVARPLIVS